MYLILLDTGSKRTTSRVTNEPGGKSSVHLGWESPKSEVIVCIVNRVTLLRLLHKAKATHFHLATVLSHPAKESKESKESKDNSQKEKENSFQVVGSAAAASNANTKIIEKKVNAKGPSVSRGVSSNVYASGSSQNTGNVITDRPTSRVTQPPGGRSSISFC